MVVAAGLMPCRNSDSVGVLIVKPMRPAGPAPRVVWTAGGGQPSTYCTDVALVISCPSASATLRVYRASPGHLPRRPPVQEAAFEPTLIRGVTLKVVTRRRQ